MNAASKDSQLHSSSHKRVPPCENTEAPTRAWPRLEQNRPGASRASMTVTKRAALSGIAGLACAAAFVALAGCAKHADTASAGQPQPLSVTAAPVHLGALTSTFSLSGTVVPARQANLASVESGT